MSIAADEGAGDRGTKEVGAGHRATSRETIAAVALARRRGGIIYALWRDGTRFDPEVVTGTDAIAG